MTRNRRESLKKTDDDYIGFDSRSRLARWERVAAVLIVVFGLIAYGEFVAAVIR